MVWGKEIVNVAPFFLSLLVFGGVGVLGRDLGTQSPYAYE